LSQRLRLFEEIKENDVKKLASQAFKELSSLAKNKHFSSKKIEEAISKVRKKK
jgi:hypothetical protein